MRKSQITIVVQLPPANETDFMNQIVTWLTQQKTTNKIDNADIRTAEIDVTTHVTI